MDKVQASMTVSLPIDILIFQILCKLPAKSLVRFKCVSKFFKILISTPELIHFHLRHSLSSKGNRYILLKGLLRGFYLFDLDSTNSPVINIPSPNTLHDADFNSSFFVGSCNGLLCFGIGNYNSSLLVINPCINTHRHINFNFTELKSITYYAFGYDHANDDYKICALVESSKNENDLVMAMAMEVWVYGLRSDSWKLAEKMSFENWFIMGKSALIDNNLVHWKFHTSSDPPQIRCFDLREEKWVADVPLPEYNLIIVDFGVLDGCLCLLTHDLNLYEQPVNYNLLNYKSDVGGDVWIMKEYGVKDSCIKLLDVSDSMVMRSIITCPLTCGERLSSWSSCSDQVLLGKYDESTLLWYNRRDKTYRVAKISVPLFYEAYMFKPSLVDVPSGEQIGVVGKPCKPGKHSIMLWKPDTNALTEVEDCNSEIVDVDPSCDHTRWEEVNVLN